MFFGRRIKRQLAIAKVSDPLVQKSTLMMTALLKKQLNEESKYPDEILWFSMWLVYLAFSTAKPNATKKEGQALSDSYNQMFVNIAGEKYKKPEQSEKINLFSFSHNFSTKMMKIFMVRVREYDDAFNLDKGTAFAVADADFHNFIPENLLALSINNIYGAEYSISGSSSFEQYFVHGFMDFFTSTVSEAAKNFKNFRL